MEFLKVNAKALVLLAIIVIAIIADALGLDVGLDIEHYVGLLVADGFVWAIPNKPKEPKEPAPTIIDSPNEEPPPPTIT